MHTPVIMAEQCSGVVVPVEDETLISLGTRPAQLGKTVTIAWYHACLASTLTIHFLSMESWLHVFYNPNIWHSRVITKIINYLNSIIC